MNELRLNPQRLALENCGGHVGLAALPGCAESVLFSLALAHTSIDGRFGCARPDCTIYLASTIYLATWRYDVTPLITPADGLTRKLPRKVIKEPRTNQRINIPNHESMALAAVAVVSHRCAVKAVIAAATRRVHVARLQDRLYESKLLAHIPAAQNSIRGQFSTWLRDAQMNLPTVTASCIHLLLIIGS